MLSFVRVWRRRGTRHRQDGEPDWPVKCSACPADLSGAPRDRPCPSCGGLSRTYYVTLAVTATAQPSIAGRDVIVGSTRSWREKWCDVLRALNALEQAYVGLPDAPTDWRALAIQFSEDCYHVKDWLMKDPLVPHPARDTADSHAHTSPAIALMGDVINTHKHRDRRRGQTPAGVSGYIVRNPALGVVSAVITFSSTRAGASHSADALDTAREAVEQWRGFFKVHGLSET